jgi:pimeloyl-ACP methyl ester carboxylesterase
MSISHCAEFVAHPFAVYFDHLTPDSSAHHPSVVMVHGGSHTGSCYLMTAEGKPGWAYRFAERGYRVAVPDWPGHGRSGALNLQTLTGEQVCQSLAALITFVPNLGRSAKAISAVNAPMSCGVVFRYPITPFQPTVISQRFIG